MSPSITKSRWRFGTSMPIADLPGIGAMMRTSSRARTRSLEVEHLVHLRARRDGDLVHRHRRAPVGCDHACIHPNVESVWPSASMMSFSCTPSFVDGGAARRRSSGGAGRGRRPSRSCGPRGSRGHGGALVVGRTRRIERADGLRLRQHDDGLGEPQPLESLRLDALEPKPGGPSLHPVPRPSRRRAARSAASRASPAPCPARRPSWPGHARRSPLGPTRSSGARRTRCRS